MIAETLRTRGDTVADDDEDRPDDQHDADDRDNREDLDDADDSTEDDEGGGDDDGPGDSDTVSREEFRKAVAARQRAKQQFRDAQKEIAALKSQNETDIEKAAREARDAAQVKADQQYKPALVRASATTSLLEAGVRGGVAGVGRVIRLMNMEDIEVLQNGDVDGVEAEVERLQEEYPELFGESEPTEDEGRRKRPGGKAVDGGGKKPPPKRMSNAELIMKKMRGEA